ncbi:MAG: phospholipase D-like domain-containing protein [Geobacteraceae bacterium]|nr:phospholipase D-like domain-containing protein [Geobacteraceae bacterium]
MAIIPRGRRGVNRAGRFMLCSCLAALLLCLSCPAVPAEPRPCGATLLKNRDYGSALLEAIRESRSSIIVSCYLFKITNFPDNYPRRIADELILARRRGIDVTVILERSRDKADFLNLENSSTATFLSRGGVDVRFDSLRKTSHAKVVVIDDRLVFLGSHNLTHSALSRNNELSVRIDSAEMAREIKTYLGKL